MDLPLQLDEFSGISLLHRASNAHYYAASDLHGEARLLVVFELRRGLKLEEQRDEFSLRARFESPQLDVLRGPPTLGHLVGFLRSQPGVVYQESGGIPLATWLERHPGPVRLEYALAFAVQLVEVLAFAHGRGVLHRGLSPSTIWVEDQAELRLRRVFGFGFANLLEAERNWSRTGTMLGEVEWMAPEQFLGAEFTPATDLYTAGLLLYRLCTGTPAVEGTSVYQLVQAHCNPAFAPPSSALGMSPQLMSLLERAMRREPRERFSAASELLAALRSEAQRVTRAIPAMSTTMPQHVGSVTTSSIRASGDAAPNRAPSALSSGKASSDAASPDRAWSEALSPKGDSPRAASPDGVSPQAAVQKADAQRAAVQRAAALTEAQEFYAPEQATAERRWVPGHATSVDRDAVLHARDVDQSQRPPDERAPAPSAQAQSSKKSTLLSSSGAIVAALLAAVAIAVVGGSFWFFSDPSDEASVARRAEERASTPAVVGLPDQRCSWDAAHPELGDGKLTVITDGDREIVADYDGAIIEITRAAATGEQAIAHVPAPNGAALYQRRFPIANQDWIFVLPAVNDMPEPKLWTFQFQGTALKSQHQLPLATRALEEATLSLEYARGECLLQLRVQERGSAADAPSQQMRLRFVDQGLVVESGALGRLYAPTR